MGELPMGVCWAWTKGIESWCVLLPLRTNPSYFRSFPNLSCFKPPPPLYLLQLELSELLTWARVPTNCAGSSKVHGNAMPLWQLIARSSAVAPA